jgi:hypothetical protein
MDMALLLEHASISSLTADLVLLYFFQQPLFSQFLRLVPSTAQSAAFQYFASILVRLSDQKVPCGDVSFTTARKLTV